MSSGVFNITGEKTFVASAATAILQFIRVKLSTAGTAGNAPLVALAGATDQEIGVVMRYVKDVVGPQGEAVNVSVPVRLISAQGTTLMVADGVITPLTGGLLGKGDVYSAANGKVTQSPSTGAHLIGYALENASADGDVIEVLPL